MNHASFYVSLLTTQVFRLIGNGSSTKVLHSEIGDSVPLRYACIDCGRDELSARSLSIDRLASACGAPNEVFRPPRLPRLRRRRETALSTAPESVVMPFHGSRCPSAVAVVSLSLGRPLRPRPRFELGLLGRFPDES